MGEENLEFSPRSAGSLNDKNSFFNNENITEKSKEKRTNCNTLSLTNIQLPEFQENEKIQGINRKIDKMRKILSQASQLLLMITNME